MQKGIFESDFLLFQQHTKNCEKIYFKLLFRNSCSFIIAVISLNLVLSNFEKTVFLHSADQDGFFMESVVGTFLPSWWSSR